MALSSCGDDDEAAVDIDTTSPYDASTPIIMDYSPTISDVPALLYLTQRDDVDLRAVTIPGTGESHCEFAVPNTRALLTLAGQGEVPVACGQIEPVGPGNSWPDEFRERADSLAGLDLPAADDGIDEEVDAANLFAEVIADSDQPVTVIAVGPLTNLAVAIDRDPDVVDNIAMVYSMGGAMDVEGNAPNGVAEWNYFVDPTAVDVVLRSGVPMTVVPLDATDQVPSTIEWFNSLTRHHTTPQADAVHGLFSEAQPWEFDIDFWDEFTAAVARNEQLATIEERSVSIDLEGDSQAQLHEDPAGSPIRVAVAADRSAFEEELLLTLNGGNQAPEANPATPAELAYFDSFADSIETFDQGVGSLYTTPTAKAAEALFEEGPEDLNARQVRLLRRFGRQFWGDGVDLLVLHRSEVERLEVSPALESVHSDYIEALDAFIADGNGLLDSFDTMSGDELVETIIQYSPPGLVLMEAACEAIQGEASLRDITPPPCNED